MRSRVQPSYLERFLSRVEWQGDCLIWTGGGHAFGYGQFHFEGRTVYAHRWLYEQTVGEIGPGLHAMHKCDVPACVNPKHITPGTPRENHHDCIAKGRKRAVRGSARPSKLLESDVYDIRVRAHAGEKLTSLATEYGISNGLVSHILAGRTWAHVDGPLGRVGLKGRSGRPKKHPYCALCGKIVRTRKTALITTAIGQVLVHAACAEQEERAP